MFPVLLCAQVPDVIWEVQVDPGQRTCVAGIFWGKLFQWDAAFGKRGTVEPLLSVQVRMV